MAAIVGKRSSLFLASAFKITLSSDGEIWGVLRGVAKAAASSRGRNMISFWLVLGNGGTPHNIS